MAWPLESIYAVIVVEAVVVKVRDGQVRDQPYDAVIGVDLDGHKDIWPGGGDGESVKFWFACLTELKNRGVEDVFFIVCDGVTGPARQQWHRVLAREGPDLPDPRLLRNSFSYASKRHWPEIAATLKPVYEAVSAIDAHPGGTEFAETWGRSYPAMIRL